MKTLRTAVIGLGIGQQHALALAKMQGIELVAVADLKDNVAADVAKRLGVRAYSEGLDLLDKEKLDFVNICTTPATHLAFTQESARRGVHVFCEKPMAPSLADCDGMIAACRQHGVKLMIGQKKRFHPAFRFLKEKLEGEFGPGRWAVLRYACGRVPMPWFWNEGDGGGPLLENSVHAMDILRFLFGEVERVHAEGGNFFNATWAPQLDAAAVSLRFRSGAVASVACGQAWEWGFGNEYTAVATEHALVEVLGSFDNPEHLRYVLRSQADKLVELHPGQSNLFELELAHFVDCVRKGAEPAVSGEVGRGSIAVCLAVKESIRTGRPVNLQ